MCWALLAFMISFNLFIPELNQMITDLDGAKYKGFIFLMFSISAAVSRPFSGKLSDTIGRKKVLYIGIVIGIITILVYPLSSTVMLFLGLRFLHGFSAGFLPTGATALVTDILPTDGRGIAMGIWGTFISVGFGLGNFFSGMILHAVGMYGLFTIAALFCALSGFLIYFVRETLPNPVPFRFSLLRIQWNDVFEPSVRPAAFVMFCAAISTGVMFATSSDICEDLHIDNKGWFFLFYMVSTIAVRIFAGKLSDVIGRRKALILGLVFMVCAMLTIGFSQEWIQFTVGAILFGVSTGVSTPTIMAWTADLSPEKRRGVGAGTAFIALEMAIMAGGLIVYWVYDDTLKTIPACYSIAALFSLLGIAYLLWHLKFKTSET